MYPTRFPIRRSVLLSLGFALAADAAPIANPDNYSTPEDTALSVAAPGVLGNDNPNGITGAMNAAKVTDPAHGTLALQPDGSFSYTPQGNYFGPDSFQYKVVEGQGPITFTVDQPNSTLTVNVQSNILATGVTDNETTTVRAKGNMTAQITPSQAPFTTAQIRTMNVALAEQASLTLCVVELFGGCIGTLTARIDPDGLVITMREDQAGPAVPVNAGVFNQPGNRIDTTGTIFLSTGGVASGIEVPPSAALNSTDGAYDFINAGITQSGGTLTLAAPIDISQVVTDPQYTATVRITGTIRATAPVPSAGGESPPTTVTLNVTSVDDPPVAVMDRYYTRQNFAINIPATGSQPFSETLIPVNSVWKFSTGADLGTGWRATDFVDTAWATGTGVLGYGDADITAAGTIPARANMAAVASASNPNYPTAYFRKEINLTAASATVDARVEFQRDDACIIYVNGTEVYRDSTPYAAGGAPPFAATGEIAYATYCAAGITPDSDGAVYKSIAINPALLREGKNIIAAEVHQTSNTSSDLRFDLRCFRTAQPTETLVGGGSIWKYSTGASPGAAWRNAEYNDAAWQGAAGPLGYDTDIPPASTIPARANMAAAASVTNPNYPTAYFRREFTLANPFDTVQPRVEFQRDDACIIYVNGVEIYRDSTPYAGDPDPPLAASGEVAYATYSAATISEADSLAYKSVAFSRALLREGRNVIAAEVHQAGATSSDLRFDLKCYRTTGVGGLGSNDTDSDGPAMHLVVHIPPANGSVSLNPDGSFTYLPNPGFPGAGASATDSFVYRHTAGGASFASSAVLVPMGSAWKFLDTGVAAPTDAGITPADWRNAAFNDAAWLAGSGQFGYGDGDEATIIEDDATPGSPTTGSTTRYITTYFRQKFNYSGSTELLSSLKVRVIRDDGVVIFLNGRRIVRDNVPENWTHTTLTETTVGGADESTPVEWLDIPASALRAGENILAAEVHQAASDSSDVSFDMELSAESIVGALVEIIVLNDDLDNDNVSDTWERSFGLDATVSDGDADEDGDGQSNRAEFLAGTDPLDASSRFHAGFLTQPNPAQLQLAFDSVPGRTYQLQQSDALGAWLDTGASFPAHATNPQTVIQFGKPADPRKFYRVRGTNDWQ